MAIVPDLNFVSNRSEKAWLNIGPIPHTLGLFLCPYNAIIKIKKNMPIVPDLNFVSNRGNKAWLNISPIPHILGLFLCPHNLCVVILLLLSPYQVKWEWAYLK